jgi:hypothetical protein
MAMVAIELGQSAPDTRRFLLVPFAPMRPNAQCLFDLHVSNLKWRFENVKQNQAKALEPTSTALAMSPVGMYASPQIVQGC